MSSTITYKSGPVITSGRVNCLGNVYTNVEFSTPFSSTSNNNIIVVANSRDWNNPTLITSFDIRWISTTGFSIQGYYKDGGAGQDGGGPYVGWVSWIATSVS